MKFVALVKQIGVCKTPVGKEYLEGVTSDKGKFREICVMSDTAYTY
jgi:hypothetical protein